MKQTIETIIPFSDWGMGNAVVKVEMDGLPKLPENAQLITMADGMGYGNAAAINKITGEEYILTEKNGKEVWA
jgi:hypothetical protein